MEQYNTLDYYNKNAKLYFEQTVEGDLKENYDKFLSKIAKKSYILDFGCGSGRDSKYFMEKGYKVKAIDNRSKNCITFLDMLYNVPYIPRQPTPYKNKKPA